MGTRHGKPRAPDEQQAKSLSGAGGSATTCLSLCNVVANGLLHHSAGSPVDVGYEQFSESALSGYEAFNFPRASEMEGYPSGTAIRNYGTVSADQQKEMSGLKFVQGLAGRLWQQSGCRDHLPRRQGMPKAVRGTVRGGGTSWPVCDSSRPIRRLAATLPSCPLPRPASDNPAPPARTSPPGCHCPNAQRTGWVESVKVNSP